MKDRKETDSSQHRWTRFCNPRNQTVVVTACSRCGKVKSGWTSNLRCIETSKSDHPMLRLGWKKFSKVRGVNSSYKSSMDSDQDTNKAAA